MEIWLKQGKTNFRFAVLPSEYELTSESDNTQVVINSLGEINLLEKEIEKYVLFLFFSETEIQFLRIHDIPDTKGKCKADRKNEK